MNSITLAQREALDVVKDMIDNSNTDVPEFGTKVMTLILGILNVDCRVEHTTIDITDITDIGGGKPILININEGSDKLQVPDLIKEKQIPPFSPHTPFPPQVWYNNEHEYTTEVSCTGDKNGIVYTTNTADVQYNGDFRDVQTSFNDK